jgi:3alpha(or 20beta)-hydroxysteroid dehydrogenase
MREYHRGRVVVITGGSRGQGAVEAKILCKLGATVIICDVLDDEGEELVGELHGTGYSALNQRLDVSDGDHWAAVGKTVMDKYKRIDALVNNAGIPLRGASFLSTSRADWDRLISTNLTGPMLGIQTLAPLMRDSGGGSIVNIGSTARMTGHFTSAYSVTKWGLRGLTKSAAMEFADWNIRVNCVHPGIVMTPFVAGSDDFVDAMTSMTALGRAAEPFEIANVVVFLISDEARYITGIDLPVDGGFSELERIPVTLRHSLRG